MRRGWLIAIAGIVALLLLALSWAVRRSADTRRVGNNVAVALGALRLLPTEINSCRSWGIDRPMFRDLKAQHREITFSIGVPFC